MPPVLEIRAAAKRLQAGVPGCAASALLFREVWLRVDAGERVAVRATSEAACTALLQVAAGLARPDAGVARLAAGGAAFVPASAPPLGGLTVADLLEWHRRALLARGATAPRSPLDALRVARCEALSGVRVRLLSPAAALRVAVARAVVGRPALLAVDGSSPALLPDEWRELDRALCGVAASDTAVLFGAPAGVAIADDVRVFHLRSTHVDRPPILGRASRRGGGAPSAARRAVAEQLPPSD